MDSIKVNKSKLSAVVTSNRDKHRQQFEEALDGWYRACIDTLEKSLDDAKNNRIRQMMINLPRPEDHTSDYDRIIAMLDMSVDIEIELDEHEFAQYVQDDWGWRRQWTMSNSAYAGSIRNDAIASGYIAGN